eukprot:364228-Chlamydomonas_euryale.AAC.19
MAMGCILNMQAHPKIGKGHRIAADKSPAGHGKALPAAKAHETHSDSAGQQLRPELQHTDTTAMPIQLPTLRGPTKCTTCTSTGSTCGALPASRSHRQCH